LDIPCWSDFHQKVPRDFSGANLNSGGRQKLAVSILWVPLSAAGVSKGFEKGYMALNRWIASTLVEKGLEKIRSRLELKMSHRGRTET